MRRLYLVRHARAVERHCFSGEDSLRPLTGEGLKQAQSLPGIIDSLDDPPTLLVASPARRCSETISPLAAALCLELVEEACLAEGAAPTEALKSLEASDAEVVAACTHGDVIWGILELLAHGGVLLGGRPDAAKGSTWVLDWGGPGELPTRASYLAPPL